MPSDLKIWRCTAQILTLHIGSIEAINSAPKDPTIVRVALWRFAVNDFFKCFKRSASRKKLSADEVFQSDTEGRKIFKHYEDLRDKHIAHDENAYSQCMAGAILNKVNSKDGIAEIISPVFTTQTFDQSAYSNIKLLCEKTISWVEVEYDKVAFKIKTELEQIPYQELLKQDMIVYRAPTPNEVSGNRN
jgi:hypothetical protein